MSLSHFAACDLPCLACPCLLTPLAPLRLVEQGSHHSHHSRHFHHRSPSRQPYTPLQKTAVQTLHEYASKMRLPPPTFEIVELEGGSDGYMTTCSLSTLQAEGKSTTKSSSKQIAARILLSKLNLGLIFSKENICVGYNACNVGLPVSYATDTDSVHSDVSSVSDCDSGVLTSLLHRLCDVCEGMR